MEKLAQLTPGKRKKKRKDGGPPKKKGERSCKTKSIKGVITERSRARDLSGREKS